MLGDKLIPKIGGVKLRENAGLPAVVLFLVALGLRVYHLSAHPLWLDEIYGYLSGERGLAALLQNSLHDPHPPLYYLFQWIASGFGSFHTEWAWRWPSVLFSALAVPLVYFNASRVANRLNAFLGALLLAIAPTYLFFSQEARAFAFAVFLAALSPLLLWRIQQKPQGKGGWIGLALLTVLGLYSSYSYSLIAFIQVAYLAVYFPRNRLFYVYLSIIVASFLPLVFPVMNSLGSTLDKNAAAPILTFQWLFQSLLAGEPARYGLGWQHTWMPVLLGICAVPGLWACLRASGKDSTGPYFVVQLCLPLLVYFLVAGLFDAPLPYTESKQFISLLPALFIILSAGLYFFQQRLPSPAYVVVTGLLVGAMTAGSIAGIGRYWSVPKSPEGLAALFVKGHSLPEDAIVSTHYSLDVALSFYHGEHNIYIKPRLDGDQMIFSDISIETTAPDDLPVSPVQFELESIRAYPRVWLLTRTDQNQSLAARISAGCDQLGLWQFPPFQVMLLEKCTN
jgi:4-amino-4-deoxy-L-arabinose transferase-like glycosyltransferase